MTTVNDLCTAMETIAPTTHAAQWDNVGLLVGRTDAPVSSVLLCIDLTRAVVAEASEAGAQAVVAYHPPIFSPRTSLRDDEPSGTMLLDAIESGIAIFSPHTALDAAPDGMSDWLARGIGHGDLAPLEPSLEHRDTETVKVVTYAPREAVEGVRAAMAAAGAGHIGDYTHCSTSIESTGTFLGGPGTSPTTGTAGTLETVQECRLMMICRESALPETLHALRTAHPYEEPPVHVIELRRHPLHDSGIGRALVLHEPQPLPAVVERLKAHLGVAHLRVAEGLEGPDAHVVAGCCPGAGGTLLESAERAGATLYVTGEMRHHDVLAARERGTSIILAGHTNTERAYLPVLRDRLHEMIGDCTIAVSDADIIPWRTR